MAEADTCARSVEASEGGRARIVHRGMLRDLLVLGGLIFARMDTHLLAVGLAVFAVGAVLHLWSKACLMRNFMVTRHGPYRFVRHPFYLANLIIDLGICLICGNLYLLIAYLPLFLLSYIPTIRQEERDLTAGHGEGYREYMREVPMLVSLRIDHIFGPWDGAWTNIWRENEFTRLGRILAIPFYFVFVDAVYHHHMIARGSLSIAIAAGSAGMAVIINILAARAKHWSRQRMLSAADLSELEAI